jgi:hypothetical protein
VAGVRARPDLRDIENAVIHLVGLGAWFGQKEHEWPRLWHDEGTSDDVFASDDSDSWRQPSVCIAMAATPP